MSGQAYTLAMYRVRPGSENDFIQSWNALAETFRSLDNPPLWGTLIRHASDRRLFYSFGPWQDAGDVRMMRENPDAGRAFARIRELCEEMTPGDYEVVTHVEVRNESRS